MSGLALTYPAPDNEQDFEQLCLRLFRRHWCPDAQRHGRRGQRQNGVDIFGIDSQGACIGGQCKCIDPSTTIDPDTEITPDVERAKGFRPRLKTFVVFTTGKRDAAVQQFAANLTLKHLSSELFSVVVFGWEDIEELLRIYTDVVQEFFNFPISPTSEKKLDTILAVLGSTRENDTSRVNSKINEAKAFIEKFNFDLARIILTEVKNSEWDSLSPAQKSRVLTLNGFMAQAEGRLEEAANLFKEAKSLLPDDETTRQNEALACYLRGQVSEAATLADQLIRDYPESLHMHALRVTVARSDVSTKVLASEVPIAALDHPAVLYAITRRALERRELDEAEVYARRALEKGPHSYMAHESLALVLIARTEGKDANASVSQLIHERVTEAESHLSEAIRLVGENGPKNIRAGLLYNRALSRAFQKRLTDAELDLYNANSLDPCDAEFAFAYGRLLADRGEVNKAIEILDDNFGRNSSARTAAILIELLLTAKPDDYLDLASDILKRALLVLDASDEYSISLVDKAVSLGLERTELRSILVEIPSEWSNVPKELYEYACVKSLVLLNRHEEARSRFLRSWETYRSFQSRNFRRHAATLAQSLGLFAEALILWRSVAFDDVVDFDFLNLLKCAKKSGAIDILLDYCRDARSKGAYDIRCYDWEVESLEELNEIFAAIELTEDYISRTKSTKERKYLNFRLLRLKIFSNTSIAHFPITDLPGADDASPKIAEEIVKILGQLERREEAIQYAYTYYRRHRDEHEAHKGIIASILGYTSSLNILNAPDSIGVGAGVIYQEEGAEKSAWLIFEDDELVSPLHNEYGQDSSMFKELVGKRSGEQFYIRRDAIQDRVGTIIEIQSKYVRRFQDCCQYFEERFPGDGSLISVRLPKKESGEPDVAPLLKSVDLRAQSAEKQLALYSSDFVPISMLAKVFGVTVFETVLNLIAGKRTIKCCEGSDKEQVAASKQIRNECALVLDATALATLYWSEAYKLFPLLPFKLVVSEGTLFELRQGISDITSRLGSDFLGSNLDGTYFFVRGSDRDSASTVSSLNEFLDAIESNCEVNGGRAILRLKTDRRDELIEACGRSAVESIALASNPGSILWTDDGVLAQVAKHEFGTGRCWSQVIFEQAATLGAIDEKTAAELMLKLLINRYEFTTIHIRDISHALEKSDLDPAKEPFPSVVRLLTSPKLKKESRVFLAMHLVKKSWQFAMVDEKAYPVTEMVLQGLLDIDPTFHLLMQLRDSIEHVFSVDVLTAARAKDYIESWIRYRKNPLLP